MDRQDQESESSTSFSDRKGSEIWEIKGSFEIQKMLLQKLARQENAAKGLISKWPKRGPGGQRIMDSEWEASPEPTVSASSTDLEAYRKDVALAISTIWGRS